MAMSHRKKANEEELRRCRLSVIVYDIPIETTLGDIRSLLRRRIEIVFGKPFRGEERKKAYLNFTKEEQVNEMIKDGSLFLQGHEMRISRYLPKSYPLSGYITTNLRLIIGDTQRQSEVREKVSEFDLKKYFEQFGEIVDCDWQNRNEVILQFRK